MELPNRVDNKVSGAEWQYQLAIRLSRWPNVIFVISFE